MTDTPEAVRLAELLSADPTESPVSLAAAALLRRIPELETARDVAVELAAQYAAERDQLLAELEKVPPQLGYTSMMGDAIFAGIFEDKIRPINNAVVVEFNSVDELRSFLRWHHSRAPTPPHADQKGQ